MSVIQLRIDKGDYLLRTIPGERKIAKETGVSYMTARRAVTELVKKKILIRRPNGALEPHPDYSKRTVESNIALLCPSFPSPHLARLCWIVESAIKQQESMLRPVHYVHWDDPIVYEALSQAKGALVIPSTDAVPSRILPIMKANKVVVLDGNLAEEGIPSIQLFPKAHIEQVLKYLTELGHRRIDCVNAQHENPEIDRRIALWRQWLLDHNCTGKLWSNPAPSFADATQYAYDMMCRVIDEGKVTATAIIGTTYPATIATVRALWERGRSIGKDISVCAINVEQHSSFYCPAITGLDIPDLSRVLTQCFDWFGNDSDAVWSDKPLLEPHEPRLVIGESCGKAAPR